jgi:hypothetical protein
VNAQEYFGLHVIDSMPKEEEEMESELETTCVKIGIVAKKRRKKESRRRCT